jgi:hypothetical protein
VKTISTSCSYSSANAAVEEKTEMERTMENGGKKNTKNTKRAVSIAGLVGNSQRRGRDSCCG